MSEQQMGIITALLYCSVAVLVIPTLIWLISRILPRTPAETKKSTVSRMLQFSAYLMLAVWCLRYAVGYYEIVVPTPESGNLTWFEEIFNSIAHTLQSFSMDEDYTHYIVSGKKMVAAVCGEKSPLIGLYGAYTSVLNVAAIIAGGAILFELLASIFPKLRLRFSYLAFWKEKYYFSELNEASVALAKSICTLNLGIFKRPMFIFTDVYIDDESENHSELLLEAKLLGAVCVRDDLAHVKKNAWGRRTFFLVDEAEAGNLQALVDLSDERNCKYLSKAEIFLFTSDDAYIQVEQRVRDKLKKKLKEENLPTFIPVQSYRNLIANLLTEIPLYEPLVGKQPEEDGTQTLTVTILGKGYIGTEMFLNTYWMGQMLDCKLKIRVLSQETEEEFWGKIDYINPEIKRTTDPNDSILEYNRKGEKAPVYCQVEYLQCDVKSSSFVSYLTDPKQNILDTDYFLVSLGSDEVNISVAETLRKYVGQHHIHLQQPLKTVIAYVVYDSELAQTLNQKKAFSFVADKMGIYMKAIGSLRTVYSAENIFMTKHVQQAENSHKAYLSVQDREERAKTHDERLKEDYKYWASMARGMHIKYKVYSMGFIHRSIFDYPEDSADHQKMVEAAIADCRKMAGGEIQFADQAQEKAHLELLHRMAWLEHRRWNAFTRVKGYRSTKDYKLYAQKNVEGSYKQMDLKLHPCLVECDQKGIRATISAKGEIDLKSRFQRTDVENFDFLDELTFYLQREGIISYDFKENDYPAFSLKE